MIRIAIFHLLLLTALVYALRKGGGPERAMALIILAMSVSDLLQLLPLLAHFSKAVNVSIQPVAYLTTQVGASWLLPPLLVLATWRHQRRIRTTGSDRSWHASWRRSTPATANR